MDSRKHFVLIHGICHGAWCWYKVVTMLKQAGHRVTALDLGGSGADPKRLDEIASVSDYLQPLMDFMASLSQEDKVILVGHSYGGLSISLAMENFPHKILAAVFASAYMPHCRASPVTLMHDYFSRTSIESLMDCQFGFEQGTENPPTSAVIGPEFMRTNLYQHCQLEDLELAKMLVRPSGLFIKDWAQDHNLLTQDKFGSVNRAFIVLGDDQTMKEDFQRFMIDNSPPKEVKLIEDCGHMVMLSKPKELCLCLQEIAEKYH